MEVIKYKFIVTALDYRNALFGEVFRMEASEALLHAKHLRLLRVTQDNAARLLTRSSRGNHITPVLQQLHWLPVMKRVDFKVLTLIYKALHEENCPD